MPDTYEHAEFAPSGAERWLTCPGSIGLSRNMEEPETSIAAETGTAAHWLFEDFSKRKGATEAPNGIEITSAMRKHVYDSLKEVMDNVKPPYLEVLKEHRLQVWKVLGLKRPVTWGTVDLVIFTESRAWLIDFKYGKYKVPVKENPQLLTYAVGLLPKLEKYKELNLVISQPRGGGSTFNRWVIPVDEIEEWKKTLQAYFTDRRDRNFRKTLIPGDHCYFCLAKHICSARMF